MSSNITMSVLRGENGKVYGTWKAAETVGSSNAPRLMAACTICGNRQAFDVHTWHRVTQGTEVRCGNASSHRVAQKAAPKPLTLQILQAMPSDEYRRKLEHEPGFREKAEALWATAPKVLDRKQAIQRKEANDRAAKIAAREAQLAPHREMWKRLFMVCTGTCTRPVATFEDFCRLKPAERDAIIEKYNLKNDDGLVHFA